MKTALITGASGGLGRALAYEFANNGVGLILHSRKSNLPEIDNVQCEWIKGDIRDKETIINLVRAATRLGANVLINNAGIYCNDFVANVPESFIQRVIEINLLAPMLLTKAMWPVLRGNEAGGTIININSIAGKGGSAYESIYCASKHGLRGFSTSLQKLEATKSNINVIDVYIGAMKTEMTRHRKDYKLFIDPTEAAAAIFNVCQNYKSMNIREIEIGRRNYQ